MNLIFPLTVFAGIRDWPLLLTECMNALKPGGWLEVIEMDCKPASDDNSLPDNSQVTEFFRLVKEAATSATIGFDLDIASKLEGLIQDAGFANVVEEQLKLPLGPWPKNMELSQIGIYEREQFLQGLPSIGMSYLTRVHGWSVKEAEALFEKVAEEVMDDSIHCYWKT
jgi:hypothetical protein